MRGIRGLAALAVGLTGLAGCGGDGLKRVTVQGKVTAAGAPVASATVSFVPENGTKGEGGIATSNADGAFSLTGSREGASGIVPGKYRVRVNRMMDKDGTILPPEAKQADYPDAGESVPPPYSSPSSPIVVTVPEGGGAVAVEIPVKLKGGPKK
jgi:hypothetical protein